MIRVLISLRVRQDPSLRVNTGYFCVITNLPAPFSNGFDQLLNKGSYPTLGIQLIIVKGKIAEGKKDRCFSEKMLADHILQGLV